VEPIFPWLAYGVGPDRQNFRRILAARLRARARTSDGAVEDRIGRSKALADSVVADHVIDNTGSPESAAARLLDVIRATVPEASL
jgi:ribose 1,5-bisphosphokinase PhnN